jgi:hypothetical protein
MARNPSWAKEFRFSFTGPHIENASGESDIRTDLTSTSLVSFIAVLLLFLVAFRQPEGALLVALPLAIGLIWTIGLASLFVDRITQVTLTFAAIMIGLSMDFAIHFYNRFSDDIRGGKSVEDALRIAIAQTGPSIVAGAITTGVAFFAMTLTRFEGFRQLGAHHPHVAAAQACAAPHGNLRVEEGGLCGDGLPADGGGRGVVRGGLLRILRHEGPVQRGLPEPAAAERSVPGAADAHRNALRGAGQSGDRDP